MTTIGKVAVAVGSVTGVTGIAATSAVLSGGSSGEVSPENLPAKEPTQLPVKKLFKKPTWNHKSIPELGHAKNIQEQTIEIPCVNNFFKNINWNKDQSLPEPDFTNISEFPNDENTKGCLVIEYYRQDYESPWWWGEFRLIWSLKDAKNKQGFLTVVDVKTKNAKLYGSSAAYILKQQGDDNNKWTVEHSKVKEERTITDSNGNRELANLIPAAGDSLFEFQAKNYWGFNASDLWICETEDNCSESKTPKTDHQFLNWELKEIKTWNNIGNWCQNLRTWLNNNFGWGSFVDKISKVMGKWTEVPKVQTSTKSE